MKPAKRRPLGVLHSEYPGQQQHARRRHTDTIHFLRFVPISSPLSLWLGTAWRAGHFTFGAAPGGDAESDADHKCRGAADATPGPGVVWENQCGDQSEV